MLNISNIQKDTLCEVRLLHPRLPRPGEKTASPFLGLVLGGCLRASPRRDRFWLVTFSRVWHFLLLTVGHFRY